MKKLLALIFLFTTLLACSKKKVAVPEEMIQMKDMQIILRDIHLAQSAATTESISDSSKYSAKEYVNYVLKDHKVTREKFLESFFSATGGRNWRSESASRRTALTVAKARRSCPNQPRVKLSKSTI